MNNSPDKSDDRRSANRLERNIKRLQKVIDLLQIIYDEDDVGGLELIFMKEKAKSALVQVQDMRKRLVASESNGALTPYLRGNERARATNSTSATNPT